MCINCKFIVCYLSIQYLDSHDVIEPNIGNYLKQILSFQSQNISIWNIVNSFIFLSNKLISNCYILPPLNLRGELIRMLNYFVDAV